MFAFLWFQKFSSYYKPQTGVFMISLRDFIYIFSNNHTILSFKKITQDTAVFVISEILDFEKFLALFVENTWLDEKIQLGWNKDTSSNE